MEYIVISAGPYSWSLQGWGVEEIRSICRIFLDFLWEEQV